MKEGPESRVVVVDDVPSDLRLPVVDRVRGFEPDAAIRKLSLI